MGGKVEQGLAPNSSIPTGMERGYKFGLLVAEAKVKGFEKPGRFKSILDRLAIMLEVVPLRKVSVMLKRLQRMR